ncbi:aminopeptidase, partial [bacterium]|nr:aminopeptidase [bacterium]
MQIPQNFKIQILNNKQDFKNQYPKPFQLKSNNDIISFSARRTNKKIDERMTEYAIKLLNENKFQEGQPLYIKGNSYYLPFMETLSKEAYKMNSGHVHIEVIEPQLEKLKEKFNKKEQFEYQKQRLKEFKDANALFIEFTETNDPYKKAGVFKKEVLEEIAKTSTSIPQKIRSLFKLNPKEILIDALDMKKGQPAVIFAEREHLPFIKKIVNFLYSKNKTDLVD